MQWIVLYETGINSIDSDHKKLVKMITKLQNSLHNGLVTETTGTVLREMVDYTKYHFESEERIMTMIKYPEIEAHKKMHHSFVNEIIVLLKGVKTGNALKSTNLINFLQKWLTSHIINEDKKIADFYHGNKEAIDAGIKKK